MIEFLILTLAVALMIISPGPDFAMVVKNSLSYGRRTGIHSAFGIAAANFCHVAINLLGIGMLIAKSILLFTCVKIIGAAYLIYVGFKGLYTSFYQGKHLENKFTEVAGSIESPSALSSSSPSAAGPKKHFNGFYSGFLTSILNPKACLFFLSFFSILISPDTKIIIQVFYGIWMSFLALSWFILVAIFFTSPVVEHKIYVIKHWIERVTGGVLLTLGVNLLRTSALE